MCEGESLLFLLVSSATFEKTESNSKKCSARFAIAEVALFGQVPLSACMKQVDIELMNILNNESFDV